MSPFNLIGPWWNCWLEDRNLVRGITGGETIEYDLMEFHGGDGSQNNYFMNAGVHQWSTGGTGFPTIYGPSNIDPTQYHKYGMLITEPVPGTSHFCSYLDDVLMGCNDVMLTATERNQRNYLIVNSSVGCSASCEGYADCIGMPIYNVLDNGSGKIRIGVNGPAPTYSGYPMACTASNYQTQISGVGGVSAANGHFLMTFISDPATCAGPCYFDLLDLTGTPVPYSGSYTTGTGTWNPIPIGINTYVKSYRVWACASWLTTQCP
jgi:hypothetical protein